MKGYIYLTTCLVNDKKYIGQSINQRNKNTYLGSGIAFKCALRKYGKDNFKKTILVDNVSCLNELNKLEREFIIILRKPIGHEVPMGGKQLSPWLNKIFLYQKFLLNLHYEIDVEN